MSKYWFKPKRYGLGAVPSSWQGWALLAAYLALMFASVFLLGVDPHTAQPRALAFFVIAFVLTLFFVALAWRKTEGGFRWRWGGDERAKSRGDPGSDTATFSRIAQPTSNL